MKGRDWYDFNWYITQGVSPNLPHLQQALQQYGPWANQTLNVDIAWLKETLKTKVESIDWGAAAQDFERFMRPVEQRSLKLWSDRFFLVCKELSYW